MRTNRIILVILLVLVATKAAHATTTAPTGIITYGILGLEDELVGFGKAIGVILGPVLTAISGTRSAIAAARHQDWVKPLLLGLLGAAVLAVVTI